ncbi:MAG: hypothetical protein AABY55_04275 [Candidatus Omnitrophota bacterium]
MDYLTVVSKLRTNKLYLFSLHDIQVLFPDENLKTLKNNLTHWISKGRFARLKRDVYELKDISVELPDLYVGNKLYEPSYISLETALSMYSIIPDIAAGVTSVTTKPTRKFSNKYGVFLYRTCRPQAFTGYRLALYEGYKVYIADKEKAVVDFLYYRLRNQRSIDFDEERLNKVILKKIKWKKALRYAGLFNKKVIEAVNKCKRYILC